jgi:DNA-binding protein YbaB
MLKKKKLNNPKHSTELGQLFKRQLDEAKVQFEQMEFQSQSEDGTVSVVVTGRREIKSLSIAHELINDKKGGLEALVSFVVNDALRIVKAANIKLTDEVTRKFNEQMGT